MFSRIGIFPDLTFGLTNNDIVDQVRFLLAFDHLHCLIVKLIRDSFVLARLQVGRPIWEDSLHHAWKINEDNRTIP